MLLSLTLSSTVFCIMLPSLTLRAIAIGLRNARSIMKQKASVVNTLFDPLQPPRAWSAPRFPEPEAPDPPRRACPWRGPWKQYNQSSEGDTFFSPLLSSHRPRHASFIVFRGRVKDGARLSLLFYLGFPHFFRCPFHAFFVRRFFAFLNRHWHFWYSRSFQRNEQGNLYRQGFTADKKWRSRRKAKNAVTFFSITFLTISQGKHHNVCIRPIAHKLCYIIFTILKENRPYVKCQPWLPSFSLRVCFADPFSRPFLYPSSPPGRFSRKFSGQAWLFIAGLSFQALFLWNGRVI